MTCLKDSRYVGGCVDVEWSAWIQLTVIDRLVIIEKLYRGLFFFDKSFQRFSMEEMITGIANHADMMDGGEVLHICVAFICWVAFFFMVFI